MLGSSRDFFAGDKSKINKYMNEQCSDLLEQPRLPQDSNATMKAKHLYMSCMNHSKYTISLTLKNHIFNYN